MEIVHRSCFSAVTVISPDAVHIEPRGGLPTGYPVIVTVVPVRVAGVHRTPNQPTVSPRLQLNLTAA
jgi:hypothetical protein